MEEILHYQAEWRNAEYKEIVPITWKKKNCMYICKIQLENMFRMFISGLWLTLILFFKFFDTSNFVYNKYAFLFY